jgi:hypothetical protein
LIYSKPNIPPYFFIKNCILAVRCYSSSSDHSKAEAYRLNAENKYANSLRDALAAPDDGSLAVLHHLRSELDQLHAQSRVAGGGHELASSSSLPPLPRLPPIPMFAGEARELAAVSAAAAVPAPPPELPVGWVVYTDAVSGREYYHHSISLVTQWRVPGLPVGWDMFKDTVSGSVYYWNESTRVAQWDCPRGGSAGIMERVGVSVQWRMERRLKILHRLLN